MHYRTTRSRLLSLALFLSLAGCANTHARPSDPEPLPVDPVLDPPPLTTLTPIEACFTGGGHLTEVAAVDNDDVTEHGALITLAVDAEGRIAVAAEDGTLKLWTMEGFLGSLGVGELLYGAELSATPASDLLFDGERVVAGDARGLVTSWTLDGRFAVLGGVDPDVRIVAVAMDHTGAWLAHADEREGGHVMVRSQNSATLFGPFETELASVRDLAFRADGALLVAGGHGAPALELRDAVDPTIVRAFWSADVEGELVEVALARDRMVAVSAEILVGLDGGLETLWSIDASAHAPTSVAITSGGRIAVTAGADGSVRVHDVLDGAALDVADVPDPVVVRVDPRGRAVLVGSRDGGVRAFECAL